jgi:2-C-methyl-D-erythritol 4-phosphate cytidylyltransferase
MFRHGMLLRALREATHVTDEAGAIEALGYKARLVEGDTRNLKVTFPSDLLIAEGILEDGRA